MTTEPDLAKQLFGSSQDGQVYQWISEKRFISNEYRPVYLQGLVLAGDFSDGDLEGLLDAAGEDLPAAALQFAGWTQTTRSSESTWAEAAFDRLEAKAQYYSDERKRVISHLLGEVMDQFFVAAPKTDFFFDIWAQGRQIFKRCVEGMSTTRRDNLVIDIATHRSAISWIAQEILRTELWAHGRVADDRARPQDERVLSASSLDLAVRVIANRLQRISMPQLIKLPRLVGILYFLKEAKRSTTINKFRKWVPTAVPKLFLDSIEAFAAPVISSNEGRYLKISREALEEFVGLSIVTGRLASIKRSKKVQPATKERANAIEQMIERDKY